MKKTTKITLVPNAQVIITGHPVSPEQAKIINDFIKSHSISTWIHQNGSIGHIDSVKMATTFETMCEEFRQVATRFPFLEVGITFMDGQAGSYNMPLVSYVMKDGRIRRDNTGTAHMGHPPPTRQHVTSAVPLLDTKKSDD